MNTIKTQSLQIIAVAAESGVDEFVLDQRRIEVIRAAACEIGELASLIADRPLNSDELDPQLLRTLSQRIYALGSAQLRCLDQADDAEDVSARIFPRSCLEVAAHASQAFRPDPPVGVQASAR